MARHRIVCGGAGKLGSGSALHHLMPRRDSRHHTGTLRTHQFVLVEVSVGIQVKRVEHEINLVVKGPLALNSERADDTKRINPAHAHNTQGSPHQSAATEGGAALCLLHAQLLIVGVEQIPALGHQFREILFVCKGATGNQRVELCFGDAKLHVEHITPCL